MFLSPKITIFVDSNDKTMVLDNDNELLPLVDSKGNVIGSETRGRCHDGIQKPLHPVVHLHIFDNEGRLYLQLRPLTKKIQPGKWDTAVGGHIAYGETVADALQRETLEELGIVDFEPVKLAEYVFESPVERELVYIFTAVYQEDINPGEEVVEGRFWHREEIEEAIGRGILTPNFEDEYRRFLAAR